MSQTLKDIVKTVKIELALMKQERQEGRSVAECVERHMANILMGIYNAAEQMKHRGHYKALRTLLGETVQFGVVSVADLFVRKMVLNYLEKKAKGLPDVRNTA